MGSMEDRFRRRQGEAQGSSEPLAWPSGWQAPALDNSRLTEDQKLEAWRQLHAVHLQRQTKAIESIRSYVAIWFWLTFVGAVLWGIAINNV